MRLYEIMPGFRCPVEDLTFREVTGFIYLDAADNGAFDSGTDTPIAGRQVTLCLGPYIVEQVVTDASGNYAFSPVPQGLAGFPYIVKVNLNSFAPQTLPEFPLGADTVSNTGNHYTEWRAVGDTTGAQFGDVCLTLKTDCGTDIAGAIVNLYSGGGLVDSQTTDASGYVEFLQKPTGNYVAEIDTDGTAAQYMFMSPNNGWDNVDQTRSFAISGTKTDLSEVFVDDPETVLADIKVVGQPDTTYDVFDASGCHIWFAETDADGCADICFVRPQELTIGTKTINANAYANNEVNL